MATYSSRVFQHPSPEQKTRWTRWVLPEGLDGPREGWRGVGVAPVPGRPGRPGKGDQL